MRETSPKFHDLQLAFASARSLIKDLPLHDVRTDDQQLKLKSFVLLCHAAIEEYLEDLSIWVLKQSRLIFLATAVIPQPLLSVEAYYSLPQGNDSANIGPHTVSQFFARLCDQAIDKHEDELTAVHGIKTKDQDAIFLPLGIRMHSFDHVLSQKLNGFGGMRGSFAHSFRIKQTLPRAALEQNIVIIERLLLPFDNEMSARIARGIS
ncbi:HEPN domain-containing protein [Rhizobium leguminosarum]|uniref:HEPN domain-containing protein n=1 Tax=Rhizobium leguminosarum TaxID=384 RepID=UPI003F967C9B